MRFIAAAMAIKDPVTIFMMVLHVARASRLPTHEVNTL